MVFLGWKDLCSKQNPPVDPSNLKYIVRRLVTNPITQGVINDYAPGVNPWPGKTFNIGDRGAQALLGTPNGYGVGFLLLQHQTTFGNKKIQKVIVWNDATVNTEPNMLFEIGDEQNPTEPMAVAWEWEGLAGDDIMLDARSEKRREI